MNAIRNPSFQRTGRLYRVQGSIHAKVSAAIGELVWIRVNHGKKVPAEVIGFDDDRAQLMPMMSGYQFHEGDLVIASGSPMKIPVGKQLLGRVLDATGTPIDNQGYLKTRQHVSLQVRPPTPMDRADISKPFETGIRAIDSMLTIGMGQRVGIFAGSGVGKSTLLGNIARHAVSDVNVVVLVGERGREVRPFIENCLGPDGMKKSVVIVSTSDESPLFRVRAVETAISIAHWLRDQNLNVLMMMDSLTRFASAQKELGLLLGEPPSTRGYPPSVFQKMAGVLEQLGNSATGSITGLITVLVDGDDMNEPVADSARSILDGHIVLKRELAEKNHYPAIDVLASISRLAREITSQEHQQSVATLRNTMSLYREVELLVQIGAYKRGNTPATDSAIDSNPLIHKFLQQANEKTNFETTLKLLDQLATHCRTRASEAAQ